MHSLALSSTSGRFGRRQRRREQRDGATSRSSRFWYAMCGVGGVGGFILRLGSPGLGGMPGGINNAQLNAAGMNPFNMNMFSMANLSADCLCQRWVRTTRTGGSRWYCRIRGEAGLAAMVPGRGGPGRSGGRSPGLNTTATAAHPHPQQETTAPARRNAKNISTLQHRTTSQDGSARSDCTSTRRTLRVCPGRKWC